MQIQDVIRTRRSIKEFSPTPVARAAVEELLDLALQAPNHRLTHPLRFHVLGPTARRGYGEILGARKAKKLEDPEAARALIAKVGESEAAIPVTIAVTVRLDQNPEIREEDHATAMMAVQNLMLGAVALGLGSHLRSGAVLDDPRFRDLLGVAEGERIAALVQVGEPATVPDAKARKGVTEVTTWHD